MAKMSSFETKMLREARRQTKILETILESGQEDEEPGDTDPPPWLEQDCKHRILVETQRVYDKGEKLWKVADDDKEMASALNNILHWIFEFQDKVREGHVEITPKFWEETGAQRACKEMGEELGLPHE